MPKKSIQFYGDTSVIKLLDKLGADVPKALTKALKDSIEIPADEMKYFVSRAGHYETGLTEESFEVEEPVYDSKTGTITAKIGFSVKKGGLASIFLNFGGMYNQPYFFIDKAVDDNVDAIKKAQIEALKSIIKELS